MRVHDPKPLPNLTVPKKLHKPSIDIPKVYGPSGDASMPNVLGGQIIRTQRITTYHHTSPHITPSTGGANHTTLLLFPHSALTATSPMNLQKSNAKKSSSKSSLPNAKFKLVKQQSILRQAGG
jgi:hypothetical protein